MNEITITRDTVVKHPGGGGQLAEPGDIFIVGETVSLKDARELISIKKAVEGNQAEDYKKKPDKPSSTQQPTAAELEAMDGEALQTYVDSIDVSELSGNRVKLLKKLWKAAEIEDDFPEA